ncbi:EAL domain-containing protein [Aliarcobacter skirrowii]|uniref:EAL domain-containing protein n=1 Tax=Aliarcobacter skirrowii TaxID=28200 RepID=UPI000F682E3A|nr:EAL domain-containing protein [Aliarcobacter skirrowii]AZL54833.1 EAL domain-containing protein [Aliarcobacter skirrowii]
MQSTNSNLLPNRKEFLSDIEKNIFDKLVIFDISGFGNINHFYGYDFGEKILKIISLRLQDRFENSQIYYLGADIFVVATNSDILKEKFIQTIKATIWYFGYSAIEIDGNKVYIPLRAGVAINYSKLLFCAEFALKQTRVLKQNIVIYDNEEDDVLNLSQDSIKDDLYWKSEIIEAIKRDKFEIFAQSISNQFEKKYEILVRMKDSKGEIVSPYFFIDRSKKINLYTEITKKVIQKSFEFFQNKNVGFSINLSIIDILEKDIVDFIIQKICEFDIGDFLTIEITESEGIDNIEEVVSFIKIVKSLGVKIAIDDFGTGYSNFSYLVKFQADYVKLDGSIIKDINRSLSARAVVESIVFFAKKVGMKTVAEFVSSKDIYDTCKELEIDYFQGYLFDAPKNIKELKL